MINIDAHESDWIKKLPGHQDELEVIAMARQEDNKEGRRVRSDKLSLMQRIKKELGDLVGAVQELLRWGEYRDEKAGCLTTKDGTEQMNQKLISVDEYASHVRQAFRRIFNEQIGDMGKVSPWCSEVYAGFVIVNNGSGNFYKVDYEQTQDGFAFAPRNEWIKVKRKVDFVPIDSKSNAFAFKTLDGELWWFQWTSNGFQDREGEIFTTKALEEYVERHRDDDVKGEFWYHHIPGTKFGTVKWQAMVGRFLAQAGPFDDTPVGQAFKTLFEQYPKRHPVAAPNGWGASHGYYYNPDDRKDGVYEWLEIRESTVLPSHKASNPWNPMPRIVTKERAMNEQERKELLAFGGESLVNLVEQQGQQATKDLEGQNIAYKNYAEFAGRITEIADALEDEAVKQQLMDLAAEMAQYDMMEEEEAAMDEEGYEEDEAGYDMEEMTKAFQVIADTLREEIKQAQEQTIQTVAEALGPLVNEVKKLQASDSQKIDEKVRNTPAASLSSMVQRAISAKEAEIDESHPLAQKGPETTPAPPSQETGLPSFLNMMFTGEDQKR
ncbi:hypothetical protein GF380_00905 [Candidatus Uhrbacteria bacterium]|nr:hypothetical protein [Candidatus Uhrbacteria bacterium]